MLNATKSPPIVVRNRVRLRPLSTQRETCPANNLQRKTGTSAAHFLVKFATKRIITGLSSKFIWKRAIQWAIRIIVTILKQKWCRKQFTPVSFVIKIFYLIQITWECISKTVTVKSLWKHMRLNTSTRLQRKLIWAKMTGCTVANTTAKFVQGAEAKVGIMIKGCFNGAKIVSPGQIRTFWKALLMVNQKISLAWLQR